MPRSPTPPPIARVEVTAVAAAVVLSSVDREVQHLRQQQARLSEQVSRWVMARIRFRACFGQGGLERRSGIGSHLNGAKCSSSGVPDACKRSVYVSGANTEAQRAGRILPLTCQKQQ